MSKCILNAHTFAYYGCLGFCKAGAFAVKYVVRPMIVVALPCWAIEHFSADFLWPLGLHGTTDMDSSRPSFLTPHALFEFEWCYIILINRRKKWIREIPVLQKETRVFQKLKTSHFWFALNAGTVVSSLSGTSSCSMNLMKMVPASKLQKPCQMSGWCQCHASAISPDPGSGEIEIGELRKYLVWKNIDRCNEENDDSVRNVARCALFVTERKDGRTHKK